jgi:hypothetical protein
VLQGVFVAPAAPKPGNVPVALLMRLASSLIPSARAYPMLLFLCFLRAQGVFVAPDAPKPEEVPQGAVDSTGNPVNVLLYQQFWELQVRLCECILIQHRTNCQQ